MINCLPLYEFESKKTACLIFNAILKRQIGNRTPTVDYITDHPKIILSLLRGYLSKDIALNCGLMLRECLKYEALTQILIETEEFYKLFEFIELPTFDIASDAFASFETLLTKHKMFTASLFTESYDKMMGEFNKLLSSENYVTRRQTLRLLVDLLSDPVNEEMKNRYLLGSDNLKVIMNLMRDSSKSIASEAFHVFRAFLDHPMRSKAIQDILTKNQEKIVTFIDNFINDCGILSYIVFRLMLTY